MGVCDLTVLVLEDVCAYAVEHPFGSAGESGGVAGCVNTITASFDTEEFDAGVIGEGVEHADGVAPAPNASYHGIGKFAAFLEHLGLGLVADDGLEGSNNSWEGMGSNGRADDVVCGVEFHNPGAQSFVDSVTKGSGPSFNGHDIGAKKLYSEDVEGLPSDIFLYGY